MELWLIRLHFELSYFPCLLISDAAEDKDNQVLLSGGNRLLSMEIGILHLVQSILGELLNNRGKQGLVLHKDILHVLAKHRVEELLGLFHGRVGTFEQIVAFSLLLAGKLHQVVDHIQLLAHFLSELVPQQQDLLVILVSE